MTADDFVLNINPQRLADDLWRLVQIPSPTGHERAAALAFREMLAAAGAETEWDESLYDSPAVIGRLKGNSPGRTLQLAGHTDHIELAHAMPQRTENIISGRGSYDMKYGLAIILEIVRVLKQSGCHFPGEILVTAYGLHEEPAGTKGIARLIQTGIKGDAAIVFEGPSNQAVVAGNGLARWDVELHYHAPPCHETNAAPERINLLQTVLQVTQHILAANQQLQGTHSRHPLLRKGSLFIGQIHYGDFFNRMPSTATLQGTIRWQPDRALPDVEREFELLLSSLPFPPGVSLKKTLSFIGHSYEMEETEPVVRSLQWAYHNTTGQLLPVSGSGAVCDAQRLVREGGVPTVIWGAESSPAHSGHTNEEYVVLEKMNTACRILLATVQHYLTSNAVRGN